MWRSDAGSSWPEAAQAPVHPAPKGRRDGWGQEPSFRISRGTKKGQAKLVSRRTVIVTRDGMGMRDMNVESKDGSLFALGFSLRPETKYLRPILMDRIAMLSEIVAANPADSFARYGLAMEYSKAGQIEQALAEFKTLIEKNPDYTPGYFMAAQALANASRVDEAKRWLVDGISSARRTGNNHAQSEMTAMLEDLG